MSLTKQDVFTKAYLGLKAQGFVQSINTRRSCSYRGPDNCRCAIGHLIPDDLYDPAMDPSGGVDVNGLLQSFPQIAKLFEGVPTGFLVDLQEVHDDADIPSNMEENLTRFAEHHGLEIPA